MRYFPTGVEDWFVGVLRPFFSINMATSETNWHRGFSRKNATWELHPRGRLRDPGTLTFVPGDLDLWPWHRTTVIFVQCTNRQVSSLYNGSYCVDKQTDKLTLLKTSTSLRYAMPVGNNEKQHQLKFTKCLEILADVIFVQHQRMTKIASNFTVIAKITPTEMLEI